MSKYEQIHEYIDGELAPEQESIFFSKLSGDEELRLKMKQMFAVKTTLAANIGAFSPSIESTSNIFNALGFSEVLTNSSLGKTKLWYQSDKVKYAASAIAGGVIIFLLLNFIQPLNDTDYLAGNGNQQATGIIESKNNANVPIISSHEGESDSSINSEAEKQVIIKYVYLERDTPVQSGEGSEANYLTQSRINESRPSLNDYDFEIQRSSSEMIDDVSIHSLERIQRQPGRFSLEINSSQYFMSPEPIIGPSKYALFNNHSAALTYQITENFFAGAEFRQETFYQQYEGMDEHGIINSYFQQPNFTSYGLILRYKLEGWENFNPYAQVILGGNKAGMLYRAAAGLEFVPYGNIAFRLAFEYNNLYFKHQQNWFESKKYGLNYGIAVKF